MGRLHKTLFFEIIYFYFGLSRVWIDHRNVGGYFYSVGQLLTRSGSGGHAVGSVWAADILTTRERN